MYFVLCAYLVLPLVFQLLCSDGWLELSSLMVGPNIFGPKDPEDIDDDDEDDDDDEVLLPKREEDVLC